MENPGKPFLDKTLLENAMPVKPVVEIHALPMTATDQNPFRSISGQHRSCLVHITGTGKGKDLGSVRCQHLYPWQEFKEKSFHQIRAREELAATRAQDRIENHRNTRMALEEPGKHPSHCSRSQHSHLDRSNRKIRHEDIHLGPGVRRIEDLHGMHLCGILNGQRCNCRADMGTKGCTREQVGLQAGSGTGIKAGNR